jgi:hypothetical protein
MREGDVVVVGEGESDKLASEQHSPFDFILGTKAERKLFAVKNGVFWDVTPCGSCKNRCFGGT